MTLGDDSVDGIFDGMKCTARLWRVTLGFWSANAPPGIGYSTDVPWHGTSCFEFVDDGEYRNTLDQKVAITAWATLLASRGGTELPS